MVQESQNIESIFDFLYLDNTKIKSFYAQLTGFGSLTSIKENNNSNHTRHTEGSLGIPSTFNGKHAYGSSELRANEKLYDAIPTMPREMIDKLDELGFIERELSEHSAGKLVLIQGKLSITDVNTIKDMIGPVLIQESLSQIDHRLPLKGRSKKIQQANNENKNLIDLIKAIPYALEATLFVDGCSVWMTLNRDEMVGNPHDINLKHGSLMHGKYYVLGVLDAIPNDDETIPTDSEWRNSLFAMAASLKEMMGRASSSYGITPIAIFRVIKPCS
ncbi:DUF6414 family protein [Moraxella nasicaprae]|uniref:Uncharacterized protein n=1 Tax=Moraxella nasicaprae TaxID=2904122 RepID=A0ABY6F378_9GAMM|nr:hypothetical protein [Moraxella nasicaprae]UXZ04544.1 hypothetical protein LU297_08155 [Moraxella nasicaprae]